MRTFRFSSTALDPRVLCISNRDFALVVSRCLRYEFEDLVAALDAVDVIAPQDTPEPGRADTARENAILKFRRSTAKFNRRLDTTLEGLLPGAGHRPPPAGLASDYDLLFVSTQSVNDLHDIGHIAMWRSVASVSMCYIEELYAADVAGLGNLLNILKQFDHILVGVSGTVAALAEATGRPCHYLVPSTDTLKFSPYPEAPTRVIDAYALGGGRPPEIHQALRQMAETRGWYYLYDTVIGNSRVASHVEHRRRLAEMIKRSRFFLATTARWHDRERTGGQEELGLRYFEGAAGGAVLIGNAPRNASFDEQFGWPDSVIELPSDVDGIVDVLTELDADPIRLERISKTNVSNCLRRHDHVYRWGQILDIAGLAETEAMVARRRRLEELANSIEPTIPQA